MIRARHALLLLLLPLAGCALFESKATRAMHASPDYRAGYDDGCASAADVSPHRDSQVRDEAAYGANAAYRAGWGDGFGACRLTRMPGPSMTPNPL